MPAGHRGAWHRRGAAGCGRGARLLLSGEKEMSGIAVIGLQLLMFAGLMAARRGAMGHHPRDRMGNCVRRELCWNAGQLVPAAVQFGGRWGQGEFARGHPRMSKNIVESGAFSAVERQALADQVLAR